MNPVCKKYNLTEESYRQMLNDGVLSTTIAGWNDVMTCFDRHRTITSSDSEAIYKVCEELNTCRTRVYEIVARFR